MLRKYWTPEVKAETGHIWALLWPIAVSNALLMALQVYYIIAGLSIEQWYDQ